MVVTLGMGPRPILVWKPTVKVVRCAATVSEIARCAAAHCSMICRACGSRATPAAIRRAVARGHGWFGNGTLDDLPRHLAGLRQAEGEVERPERLGRLEISYMPLDPVAVDPRSADRYAFLGVDRLVVYPLPLEDPSDVARFLERHASLPH